MTFLAMRTAIRATDTLRSGATGGRVSLASIQELGALPNGAKFYRADLHIHSFGGSHDVIDADMTPERIVDAAIADKLDVIAIADHNEINSVARALEAATGKKLLVVPAVELSTPQGHLLCYLRDADALQRFYSRLGIADRGTADSRCQNSLLDCLDELERAGAFGILAHVDGPKGLEVEMPGHSPHKNDVLCHAALLGISLGLRIRKCHIQTSIQVRSGRNAAVTA
jgi:hypothetical protein